MGKGSGLYGPPAPSTGNRDPWRRLLPQDAAVLTSARTLAPASSVRTRRDVRAAYATYQFRDALSAIVEFCNVDFSAFYVDVRKDALYCDAPSSFRTARLPHRAIDEVFSRLTAWLAPILPFTMEEAWLTRPSPSMGEVS